MKKIALTIFLIIIMMTTNVFAANDVTMELVENNVCTIKLNDKSVLEKKIVESDLENHKVTLQLKITNNAEIIIPSGELILVIDSSSSMNTKVEGETTRKDLVLNSANELVENLLKANPTSLKIGVVTFSTSSETNEDGYLVTGTASDAQEVCDLTNDLSELTGKISAIEGTGPYTNLDAGLQLAKQQFSEDDTNKYMIILTDGLPNLAVGYNDLVSYNGLTEVITQTKNTLNSLENVEIITMLTGIDNEEANIRTEGENSYTYAQVISEVFGNAEQPNVGKFYKIEDNQIEQTITDSIYRDLLPIEKTLTDITVIDYIPQYIADNFDISINKDSAELSAIISDDSKTITWKLDKLGPGESKTLKFDVVLKEKFDEAIINQILNTNEKVEIAYKDFEEAEQTQTSEVTPKIKLVQDTTIVQTPIPEAGSPVMLIGIIMIVVAAIIFGYKAFKII